MELEKSVYISEPEVYPNFHLYFVGCYHIISRIISTFGGTLYVANTFCLVA